MTDVLDDGILGVSADMLSDMEIIVMDPPAITLEFVAGVIVGWVRVPYTVDVLADVPCFSTFGVVPAIDVDMFADENVRGLAAVITPSEFTSPAPRAEPMPFCCR